MGVDVNMFFFCGVKSVYTKEVYGMITPRQRIKDLRNDHDQSQIAIARLLEISQQQYSRYENSDTEIPARIIIKLAQHYQVSTDYLLGLTDCKQVTDALNIQIAEKITLGAAISDWLALSPAGRASIANQIDLHLLKERSMAKLD